MYSITTTPQVASVLARQHVDDLIRNAQGGRLARSVRRSSRRSRSRGPAPDQPVL